jgi:hypothetical protein
VDRSGCRTGHRSHGGLLQADTSSCYSVRIVSVYADMQPIYARQHPQIRWIPGHLARCIARVAVPPGLPGRTRSSLGHSDHVPGADFGPGLPRRLGFSTGAADSGSATGAGLPTRLRLEGCTRVASASSATSASRLPVAPFWLRP